MEDKKNKTENEVDILKSDLEKSAENDVVNDDRVIKNFGDVLYYFTIGHPLVIYAIKIIAVMLHLLALVVGYIIVGHSFFKSFISDYEKGVLQKKYESEVRLEKIKYMNSDSPKYSETVMKNHQICLDIYSSGDIKYLNKNVKANCEKTKQIIELLEK